ncbi:hypothetical protein ACFOKK_00030 [Sphingobium fuliginis]|jgi:hypothetical protein
MANLTEYPAPRSHKNPEPPPTCPFINQQCQRADNHTGQLSYPVPCVPGDQRPFLLATVVSAVPVGQRRVGEGAYMEGFPNRQTLFAILFQNFLGLAG